MSHAEPDVLIAGGGLAGSALAMMLGRAGLRVELFERGKFPKDKPCGEGLMPAGVAVLRRLGLAEAVGGAPFFGVRYHFGGQTAEGRFPGADSSCTGRGQRRLHLDRIVFEAASATPGVTAQLNATVEEPLRENRRVTGVMVNDEPRRAPLVVAADGVHSRLRHRLGLNQPIRRKRIGARAHFRLAAEREQPPWVDVFVARGYEIYVTPMPGKEILVAALADAWALEGPLDQAYQRWIRSHPALAARLEGAEQISELLSTSPLAAKSRCGVAPGIVLLGDAAGFLDPITGGGMTQALMTAELLAGYIIRQPHTGDDWIYQFERERRAMLWDYATLTQIVLWLADHPRLTEKALSALRGSPALFSHLVGVAGGVRRLVDFRSLERDAPRPAREHAET
ncbi:MAG TPA: NAD(P)/FAD-dependent oxidoreductase [Candidatus Acidoferrales bacterium]|nr:NAD(P)/FAD-dependent oxidoreductase [Candidatus Acidoferrales bacterium]